MNKQVLMLVDIQNIYYGSLNFTHDKKQIDYKALVPFVQAEMLKLYSVAYPEAAQFLTVTVDPYAYVVQTPRYDGTAFFAFLKSLGFSLRSKLYLEDAMVYDPEVADEDWKGTVGSLMQMDLLDMGPNYDNVVVISGSGIFEKAFKAMRNHWPNVGRTIGAFDNTLHQVYTSTPGLVDNIILLGDDVLRNKHDRRR